VARNGTLLSHAPASLTISTRPFSVLEAPTLTALVTPIRLALRSTPSLVRAYVRAVALAAIACRTKIHYCAAASAEKAPDRLLDRQTRLNRRTTSQAALLLHSRVFRRRQQSTLACGSEPPVAARGPCFGQYPSVLSDVKNSRAMLAAAAQRS
jgi:hypothetical protein